LTGKKTEKKNDLIYFGREVRKKGEPLGPPVNDFN
jgi:hypothetical protein